MRIGISGRRCALIALLLLVVVSLAVLARAHGSYAQQDRDHIFEGSSKAHLTGTDDLGRDRTVRLAGAVLLGLAGALAASVLATALAVGVGVSAAAGPRLLGSILLYVSDLFLTLPWLFLLMIVRASLPLALTPAASAMVTFALLGLLGWPAFARIHHARVKALYGSDWMLFSRASGLPSSALFLTHLMPQMKPLVLSQFLICMPACIIAEANLGTMGLGVTDPLPSWGGMLQALQHSAVLANSRWVFLPLVMLVGVLLLLEGLSVKENV